MRSQQPGANSAGRPSKKRTPAERAEEFAAVQIRLKQEAAARRAVALRTPRASGTARVARGRQRTG